MLVLSERCKRCGREFIPAPCHVFRIGADFFCGYTCHLHEMTEREEQKRKKEEEALERRRLQQKKRNFDKYRYNKNDLHPIEKKPRVLQFDYDGNLIATYRTSKEAAASAKVAPCTMSCWLNGKVKRKSEFIWKFEEEG